MFMETIDSDKVSKILWKLISAPESNQGKPSVLKFPQTFKFIQLANSYPRKSTLAVWYPFILLKLIFRLKANIIFI